MNPPFFQWIFLLFVGCLQPPFLSGQTYILDVDRCTVQWTGKAAFSAYSLSGSLKPASGQITVKEGEGISAEFSMDMQSLDSDIKKLTRHLRSDDFFAVKTYPEADFYLREPLPLTAGPHQVQGLLRIRDKELPQEVEMVVSANPDGYRVVGSAVVDRTRFGIYYNSPSYFENLKQEAIADEFVLEFELVFVPEQ